MLDLSSDTIATLVVASVTISFPCFLYGAWIMIDNDPITWNVLVRHLSFIVTGLALTTIPLLVWMLPRLLEQFYGFSVLHAVVGLHAYAFLAFGFTGIVRIFRAKWEHDLYHDYDEELLLAEIGGDRMDHWRSRLRIGVVGYVVLWLLAYFSGLAQYVTKYGLPL
ncbi:MAG: hypothetical protein V5A34_02955 [Halapricum sp.]